MDANEAKVKEVWENIGVYGYGGKTCYVNLADVPKDFCGVDEPAAWSAAAAYTETVKRGAAELREEMMLLRSMVILLRSVPGDETAPVYKRTIGRLEAIHAAHIRGIKPEALR